MSNQIEEWKKSYDFRFTFESISNCLFAHKINRVLVEEHSRGLVKIFLPAKQYDFGKQAMKLLLAYKPMYLDVQFYKLKFWQCRNWYGAGVHFLRIICK